VTKLKSHLTYANVMATVAVFLALGGVATAAFTVPKKSVGTKQLKAKAVTEPKIGDKAVTEGKLGDGAVTAAKLAGGAAVKNVVARETVVANQGTGTFTVRDLQCAAGEQAVGGGAEGTTVGTRNFPNLDIDTRPLAFGPIDANDQAVANGQTATGWHVSIQVVTGPRDVHLYVLCAQK
jgi:hypothetical protein